MSLKNKSSIFDLVQEDDAPVGNMAGQTGPAFPIVGEKFERGIYPFSIPNNSNLHAGPNVDQAGASLVGPAYQGIYGGASQPSSLDKNGITPDKYEDNLPD